MSTPELRDHLVLAMFERAAAEGLRCPTNTEIAAHLRGRGYRTTGTGSVPDVTRRLISQGRIVVRVYGHNWRTVTICSGPQAGQVTLGPPHGGLPYRLLEAPAGPPVIVQGVP